jgi:3-oxoacyl-[acyl-carrier-protein] synthase II
LENNVSQAIAVEEWKTIEGLGSKVAHWVTPWDAKAKISREKRKTMSKMSEMLCVATQEALQQALISEQDLNTKKVIIIVGSTSGSGSTYSDFHEEYHRSNSLRGQLSTSVFKCINNSVAANLSHYLNFKGTVLSISSACSTATQAAVLGADFIRRGLYDMALVGGADECHLTSCASFDVAYAASRNFNDTPQKASRPFDQLRDGIVVSEGASMVILESERSLYKRAGFSLGQILGGASYCEGTHMVQPSKDAIKETMLRALANSRIEAPNIDYINAHATSTVAGDLAEAQAIFEVFGAKPVSSFKGHMGHSFAACGGIELILSLEMMRKQKLFGTLNLQTIDAKMPPLDFITEHRSRETKIMMSNNFAFGGMNASIVFSL